MEFSFNINELLPDSITVVNEKLAPFRNKVKSDRYEFNSKQSQLKKVIDAMGEASGRAQSLRGSITSAAKLQCSDHRLYIMKDASTNSGRGAVVGILKAGHKKLFVLDLQHVQNEVNPLCVLDFYVHESKQRMGCGKALFQHMLRMENVLPAQVAIDRPSVKFINFLKKYYDLKNVIPQVNNFVVFDQFFRDLQAVGHIPKGSQRLSGGSNVSSHNRPPIHPYRRRSQHDNDHQWGGGMRHPPTCDTSRLSSLRSASRGPHELPRASPGVSPQSSDEALKNIILPPLVPRPPSTHSRPGSRETAPGLRWGSASDLRKTPSSELINTEYNVERGMAARATCYSRHSISREGSASDKRRSKQERSGAEPMDTSSCGPHIGVVPGSAGLPRSAPGSTGTGVALGGTVGVSSGTCPSRSFSGGRRRNLHVTSSDNILGGSHVTSSDNILGGGHVNTYDRFTRARENNPEPADTNANEVNTAGTNPSYISQSGNYSISSVYNTHFGHAKGPGLGTSWNVLGVPSYIGHQTPNHPYYTRKNTQPRTFPF